MCVKEPLQDREIEEKYDCCSESVRNSVEWPWTESAKCSVNRHHFRKAKHLQLVDKESDRTIALFLEAIYTGDRRDSVLLLKKTRQLSTSKLRAFQPVESYHIYFKIYTN
ncbi:hypothetical protein SUGI_1125590 [Cryptomeria japonica]|nr:hypothetical protein SUGI_1125590 [Cryptomeria japonica]